MPNSEKDKKSNVLRELKVRLYVEKDEDIANYLRNQRTTTLNSFIRFLVRDALEKYGDQDYFQAIKKLGDIEKAKLAPKSEIKTSIKNDTPEVQINTPSSPASSSRSKVESTNMPKKALRDSTPKPREKKVSVKEKGSPQKHKRLPQDPYDIFKDGNTFE
ncbi:hypothetical protein [uncultured Lactobacillus sp.]|uniref:hypothetical protein n=1 Tax=uncultured Lactobacillus sp. TaxID=153152 RepID=UPI00259BEB40|nr:hypothetical protein [uncultured Lactobacillus sp.]